VRHLVVELPGDSGWTWQARQTRKLAEWHLMANVFQYAIQRTTPRRRLDKHFTEKQGSGGRVVHVGRARYEGNWNPEPPAWERLNVYASNAGKASPVTHELDLADIGDADVSMVHVSSTDAVKFTDARIDAMRQYVADGGVVPFYLATQFNWNRWAGILERPGGRYAASASII